MTSISRAVAVYKTNTQNRLSLESSENQKNRFPILQKNRDEENKVNSKSDSDFAKILNSKFEKEDLSQH